VTKRLKLDAWKEEVLAGNICPYCNNSTNRIKGLEIYGKNTPWSDLDFMLCRPCWAYAGVHRESGIALGSVANSTLRNKRKAAHQVFDRLYKEAHLTRSQAYTWLANQLNLDRKLTHIGMFGEESCDLVIELVVPFLEKLRQQKLSE
jgi:hypothetical protein